MPKIDAKRVCILNFDGLDPEVLSNSLHRGQLPALENILGRNFDYSHPIDAASTAPSTTYVAQAALAYGAHPKDTGVAGNQYFSREQRQARTYDLDGQLFPQFDSLNVHRRQLADRLVAPRLQSIFHRFAEHGLSSLAVHSIYGDQGSFNYRPGTLELLKYFAGRTAFGIPYEYLDNRMVEKLIRRLGDKSEDPGVVMAYFLGLDGNSHRKGPQSQDEYLRRTLDPQVGRVVSVLRELNRFDDTLFVVVSDHSHIACDPQRGIWLRPNQKRSWNSLFSTLGYTIDGQEGKFRVPALVGLNGGIAQIYLQHRLAKDWRVEPRYDQEVVPVAELLYHMNRNGKYIPDLQNAFSMILVRKGWGAAYEVFTPHGTMDVDSFLAMHPELRCLDAKRRLENLSCAGSGDILVVANWIDGFYFGKKGDSGQHGGLSVQDSRATVVFARPSANKAEVHALRDSVSQSFSTRALAENRAQSIVDVTHAICKLMLQKDQEMQGNLSITLRTKAA